MRNDSTEITESVGREAMTMNDGQDQPEPVLRCNYNTVDDPVLIKLSGVIARDLFLRIMRRMPAMGQAGAFRLRGIPDRGWQ
jgi:hypothetical protein